MNETLALKVYDVCNVVIYSANVPHVTAGTYTEIIGASRTFTATGHVKRDL